MPISRRRGYTAVGWGATLPKRAPDQRVAWANTDRVVPMRPAAMGTQGRVAPRPTADNGATFDGGMTLKQHPVRHRARGCRSFPCRYRGGGGSRQSAGARPYRSAVPDQRVAWANTDRVMPIRPAAMGTQGRVAPRPTADNGATFGGGMTLKQHPVRHRARMPIISMPISRRRGFTAVGWGATLPKRRAGPTRHMGQYRSGHADASRSNGHPR